MTLVNVNLLIKNAPKLETGFDRQLAYFILRVTLGLNILVHGLMPLLHVDSFAVGLVQLFAKTPLPRVLVHLFALLLPFAQTGVGLLLTLGLWTRFALASGGVVMTALVFGTALRNDGPGLGIQMLYAVIYYLLLTGRADDRFSIDQLRRGNSTSSRNPRSSTGALTVETDAIPNSGLANRSTRARLTLGCTPE